MCVFHKRVIKVITSPKQHGASMKASRHAVWEMTKILSRRWCQETFDFPHHAAWDECNKQGSPPTNQTGTRLETRDRKKVKKKREAEWGGAVTCGNTASDLTTTQRSKVFALHAELIAVWFSTDMRPHTNAVVTNLSICPLSHGRKQCEYYRNVEGYCNGSCQSFNTEPLQLLPTTQTLAELLRREGHFTVS